MRRPMLLCRMRWRAERSRCCWWGQSPAGWPQTNTDEPGAADAATKLYKYPRVWRFPPRSLRLCERFLFAARYSGRHPMWGRKTPAFYLSQRRRDRGERPMGVGRRTSVNSESYGLNRKSSRRETILQVGSTQIGNKGAARFHRWLKISFRSLVDSRELESRYPHLMGQLAGRLPRHQG
jgi:hypothetical protein